MIREYNDKPRVALTDKQILRLYKLGTLQLNIKALARETFSETKHKAVPNSKTLIQLYETGH